MENMLITIKKGEVSVQIPIFEGRGSFDTFKFETENSLLIIQGIILNKSELIEKLNPESFEHFLTLNLAEDIKYIENLRGSFYGFFQNKIDGCITVFNDQLGSKNIYYIEQDEKVTVTTDFNVFFKEKCQLNEESAKMLLSYGYMIDDNTILQKVKKLLPGSLLYIMVDNKSTPKIVIERYFRFSTDKNNSITEKEAIDEIDNLFRKAVIRQFQKDLEYNKKHFVALSGGLDSRMTSWVAHDIGYINQVNFTFSQSNYLDETIAKKIASDLKHEWIFKYLDNGNFLFDIDEITDISGGNVLYYGLAHSNSFLKLLNFSDLGMLHSGQLGDVIIGSFIKKFNNEELNKLGGAYSDLGSQLFPSERKYESFEEKEIDLMYQRAINGANSGLMLINKYTETFSPFYDLDFMKFCLSLPIKMRANHKLYKKWILTKYPKSAEYIWESTKRHINTNEPTINIWGRKIYIFDLKDSILRKLKLKKVPIGTKHDMNPLQYWYDTNEYLHSFINQYYTDYINLLKNNKELKEIAINLFENGTAIEKNQVLSLLSVMRRL